MGRRKISAVVVVVFLALGANGQSAVPAPTVPKLGPEDVIQVRVVDDEDLADKLFRVGADGFVSLPTVGRLHVAGTTVEEVQGAITDRLRRLLVNPDVSVSMMETHSQPVTVVGAIKTPGVTQLQGRKTLVEILSAAGGPTDDAGSTVRITRQKEFGPIPLPAAHDDATGLYSIADVNLQTIMDARDLSANILIMPNDLISVPKGQLIFVIGEVLKPGSIVLGDQKSVTVLQAIAAANGPSKTAKAGETKILRLTPGSSTRTEITINLKGMLGGKIGDVSLQPDDILYVPNSLKKEIGMKTLDAMAGTALTSVIYRVP